MILFGRVTGALQSRAGRLHGLGELAGKLIRRRGAILRVLLERMAYDRFDLRWHLDALRSERGHVGRDVLLHDRWNRAALERHLAGLHLIEPDAETVDI